MLTIAAIAAAAAIGTCVSNVINDHWRHPKLVRDAYLDGHEAGFQKALDLQAGKRDDAPGGFL